MFTAVRHIGWSSRGGPGSTTTVGLPGTTTPGAVPTGSMMNEPSGTSACLRFAARTASKSQWLKRAISGFRIPAIFSSSSLVQDELALAEAGHHLDGHVVGGRARGRRS